MMVLDQNLFRKGSSSTKYYAVSASEVPLQPNGEKSSNGCLALC